MFESGPFGCNEEKFSQTISQNKWLCVWYNGHMDFDRYWKLRHRDKYFSASLCLCFSGSFHSIPYSNLWNFSSYCGFLHFHLPTCSFVYFTSSRQIIIVPFNSTHIFSKLYFNLIYKIGTLALLGKEIIFPVSSEQLLHLGICD